MHQEEFTQRIYEIGIRLAFGARALIVLELVLRGGMAITIVVVIGFTAAFALSYLTLYSNA